MPCTGLHFNQSLPQVVQEISMQARLYHPSILSLYAAFEDSNGVYLVLVRWPADNWYWVAHEPQTIILGNEVGVI